MREITNIFMAGANGRMGKNIIQLVCDDHDTVLVGASDHPESQVQGADAGLNAGVKNLSVTIAPDLERYLQKHKGVIIDFSSPETTIRNIEKAQKYKTPIVIGTTGFDEAQTKQIHSAAKDLPIVFSPNMSVGMNLVFRLAELAAQVLHQDYDIEIFEAHHKLKKDAPSGTANRIAELLCEATGRNYPTDIEYARQGMTGERDPKKIGMQVLRGGDIVGEHTVFYCGEGERIEIKHVATRRTAFALGAIRAAKWLVKKREPGLYRMSDVLGLTK